MREILFRGKTEDGKWVEGFYLNRSNDKEDIHCIMEKFPVTVSKRVLPETVGQFTGLLDRYGKKIFEGDIVDILTESEEIGVVAYDDGGFWVNADGFCVDFHSNINGTDLEVIGNIHDNPELVEVAR